MKTTITIRVLAMDGSTTLQQIDTSTLTHRCKFDMGYEAEKELPVCPLAGRYCHSPCDMMERINGTRDAPLSVVILTPDGFYNHGNWTNIY